MLRPDETAGIALAPSVWRSSRTQAQQTFHRAVASGSVPGVGTTMVELADGAVLWTESEVRPGAPGVVFVHGGPGTWDYLAPVAEPLADLVSTHRYDQRGCGRSSPNDDHRIDRSVADLEELRVHFGYERWAVIGHSFGATLGLAYASAHPGRVTALVYCDGVGLDWPQHRVTAHARADARLGPAQRHRRDELEARERSWDEEVEWRTLCWVPDFADPEQAETLARRDAARRLEINFACNRAMGEEAKRRSAQERAACGRVTSPVLVVHGSEDPRPVEGINALVEALPDVQFELIGGTGHQPWVEQPQVFTRLVRDFLYRATA